MSKHTLATITKKINTEVVKLSWVYLIILSLLAIGLIQLYSSTMRNSQKYITKETVESLQIQVNEQQTIINQLKQDVETIKKAQSK